MPFDPCDPCCNPAASARSVETYRQGVLVALCDLIANGGGGFLGESPILSASGVFSAAGDNQIIAAPADGTTVYVVAYSITAVTTTALTAIVQDDANVELWRDIIQTPASVSGGANIAVSAPAYLFKASVINSGIDVNLSGAIAAHISMSYFLR